MTERRILLTEEDSSFLDTFEWSAVSLDTETTSLRWQGQEVLGISLSDGTRTCYVPTTNITGTRKIIAGLKNTKLIIFHNATFDAKAVQHCEIDVFDIEWFDTMVAHHLLDENAKHGLKELARTYLDKEVVSYEEASKHGTNSVEFMEYAMNDAEWTWQLAQIFRPLLDEQGLTKLFREVEMPFLRVLARMEMTGIRVDLEKVHRIRDELTQEEMRLVMDMNAALGEKCEVQQTFGTELTVKSKINFNSPAQLVRIIEGLGFSIDEKTETGRPSVGKLTIERLKDKHPFIALLHKYKIVQKLLTAFFTPLPDMVDSDGRVRPHFNDVGTVTGRLSCSQPNIQQLPSVNKEFPINTRSCFIASPGKKIVAIDYSQQELRIAAHLSQDPTLLSLIAHDGDVHLANANAVFQLGIPNEELFATNPRYQKHKKKYAKERGKGKTFTFGILYGMGPHKLSRDFNVSIPEAEAMLRKYFDGYPELERAIAETHKLVEEQGYVTTLTGRRRHFQRDANGRMDFRSMRQSFNFLIQSFGADVIRRACVRLDEYARRRPEMGITLLMTVHDEVVLEVNEDWAEYVAKQACLVLQGCAQLALPLKAESGIGLSYGDAK